MEKTRARKILLSVLLSIGFWALFLLFTYALTLYEYSLLVLLVVMGFAILTVTASIIYGML